VKVSIVTISYNQVKYLRQCIESVLMQDYFDIEYVVVDPGSTDGSRELIESYGDSISRIIFEPDFGPADGLNKGFAACTGDVLFFLNSDDFLQPAAVSRAVGCFCRHPGVDVLLASGVIVDAEGAYRKSIFPSRPSPRQLVNGASTMFQQGMFFRSSIFSYVGGFNVENMASWDAELYLDFMLAGATFRRVFFNAGAFRVYDDSITGSQRFSQKYESDFDRMFQKVFPDGGRRSRISRTGYRVLKLVTDPAYVVMTIFSRLIFFTRKGS